MQFNLNSSKAMWLHLHWHTYRYMRADVNISIHINTIYRNIKEASGWGIFISDFSFLLISFWSPANTHWSFFPSISHCYYIVLLFLLLLLLLPSSSSSRHRFDSTRLMLSRHPSIAKKCYCNNYFYPPQRIKKQRQGVGGGEGEGREKNEKYPTTPNHPSGKQSQYQIGWNHTFFFYHFVRLFIIFLYLCKYKYILDGKR